MPRSRPITNGRGPLLAATILLGSLPGILHADPPRIEAFRPSGVQRGVATTVTVSGSGLSANPVLLAPFGFELQTPDDGKTADGKGWKFSVQVPPTTPPGVYVVRVRTDDGVSNPFLFEVSHVPRAAEAEDNNAGARAQSVNAPLIVEGDLAGADIDCFRFSGKKGQKIILDARCARIGSGVDPTLRLTTADGRFLAANEDAPGLLTDARILTVLPEDGDYVAEIADTKYQGQGRTLYSLAIGDVPTAEEVFPLGGRRGETIGLELRGGTIAGQRPVAAVLSVPRGVARVLPDEAPDLDVELPTMLAVGEYPELREPPDDSPNPLRAAVPVVLNGQLDPARDEDRFTIVGLTPGQTLRVSLAAMPFASGVDGVLRVLGPSGNEIARADDSNVVLTNKGQKTAVPITSPDPVLDVAVPADTTSLTLAVSDLSGRGGPGFPYRLTVEEARPTFELELLASELNVPRGGWVNLPVNVARNGYNGPIALKVDAPPPGLLVRDATVADGQVAGVISVGLPAEGAFEPGDLTVVGVATGIDPPLTVRATRPVVFAAIQDFPTNLVNLPTLAAATTTAGPVAFETPAEPVDVAHGYGATIPVKLTRAEGATGAVELEALAIPAGVDVPKVAIAEAANEGSIAVNSTIDAPVGLSTFALTAKGKIANADRVLAVPAVNIRVVRPATIELEAPALEVKAGATAELKGKVVRQGPFKQEVVIKVDGLPAGTKVEPITLAGDATEFVLKVSADAGAAAAEGQAKVTGAFKIGDKDYPAPPQAALTIKLVP